MREEDLIMARALVAEQAAAAAAAAAESSATLLSSAQPSPGASPEPLRRTRVADLIEKRNQFSMSQSANTTINVNGRKNSSAALECIPSATNAAAAAFKENQTLCINRNSAGDGSNASSAPNVGAMREWW
ncbi:unnamed protein product [Ceratitis capitata]|uniref:(Mediterranean fruit fly) hypothetical protein n=1 Tax=Ceratitis capitata TaxID=7213 RepID=A0A811VBV9_CERCA|nr:unnamed protein product [Ceratitis capitata]